MSVATREPCVVCGVKHLRGVTHFDRPTNTRTRTKYRTVHRLVGVDIAAMALLRAIVREHEKCRALGWDDHTAFFEACEIAVKCVPMEDE